MTRAVHHIDVWVSDPGVSLGEWGWLLGEIGWEVDIEGASWVADDGTYLFLERSADQVDEPHDRLRPGINHLAFTVESRELLDRIRAASTRARLARALRRPLPPRRGRGHDRALRRELRGVRGRAGRRSEPGSGSSV